MENIAEVTEKENRGFWKVLGVFVKRNNAMFIAPAIVLSLFICALICYGVYPFGNSRTLASYDLSAQICPFIEHLFDVLQGKSSISYSYAIVGGADVTGTFLYFFISPFSFLFLIFGDGKVMYASSIVLGCKLAAIAVAGAWFAKKVFKGIPDYLCVAVGVIYAYSGYMFVASTYINWVDFLIYMPFCAGAFRHFVKTGKFLPFSLLMACCVYTCFSIACFSMFTVFPVLIVYGLLCVEKERKNKFLANLCIAFAVTVLLALPVLFPAGVAFLRSARGGNLFENVWYGFENSSGMSVPNGFDSSSFIEDWSDSMYAKWSYIISDGIFVVLTVVWFYRKGFKDTFSRFMLIAGVLLLLPTVVDEAMNLMNMGSYMSYALRFGFLTALYFLGGACLCLENLCYKAEHAIDGSPLFESVEEAENKKKRKTRSKGVCIASVAMLVLGVVAVGALIWYLLCGGFADFLSLFTDDPATAKSNLLGFASGFAHSYGGLEIIVVAFAITAIVALIGAFLASEKRVSVRLLSYILIGIVGVQVVFYNFTLVEGNSSTQHIPMQSYQTLCQELNERHEGEYFRVKDYGKIIKEEDSTKREDEWTSNAPFTGGSNSFSVFSSVIDGDNFAALELFGYLGNGKNTFKSTHNYALDSISDEFGDSFLGYRYFLVPKSEISKVEGESWLKPVLTETGERLCHGEGEEEYFVYENTIVFPNAYRVQRGDFTFVAPNDRKVDKRALNRRRNQAALYEFLRGMNLKETHDTERANTEIITELSEYLHTKSAQEVKVGAGKITVKITAEAQECLFMNFVASKGYTVTVNGKKAELIENDLHFLAVALEEGENEVVFTYSSPYVKYAGAGILVALIGLGVIALILKKTKWLDYTSPVIAWSGVILAVAVVGFFMVYPTGVFFAKLIELAKGFLLK